MGLILWSIFRSSSGSNSKAFQFGKSRVRRYDSTAKRITFTDVAGQSSAKVELAEVVDFLMQPEKFTKIGAKIPRGVLLVGMPGTGKTLLAKAVAGEAKVPFFHVPGSDFVEMFVGVGASRVRDLFEVGRQNAPCIIFIDEIDAVGRARGASLGGGQEEREQTLNQLLVEMDGFDSRDGVIVIAATNRPDTLDTALLRPGRFDRQVKVDLPSMQEREDILRLHSRHVKINEDVEFATIARATPGSSGADLSNVVNEAALFAARSNQEKVRMEDFEEARDKILMGAARNIKMMSQEELYLTAIHESGHALLHYYLDPCDPIHKVTIIPRGQALGLTFSLPKTDSFSRGKSWLLNRIKICYGGVVAEQLFQGETSTGAQNDIEQATNLARKMVCQWGMNDSLGMIWLGSSDDFTSTGMPSQKQYSQEMGWKIDEEVSHILDTSLQDVRKILKTHKNKLEKLAKTLLNKETLNDADIRALLNFDAAS